MFKNKKKWIFFGLLLIVLLLAVSYTTFKILDSIDKRDNASSLSYLGVTEENNYFIKEAPKNIRFHVSSQDVKYELLDSNNNKVSSKIVKSFNSYYIESSKNYNEGETYHLKLINGKFKDNVLKDAKDVSFTIAKSDKEEYELRKNVINLENKKLKVLEDNDNKYINLDKKYKVNDILIGSNKAVKIKKIDGNKAYVETPKLNEIYSKLDYHKSGYVDFTKAKISDEIEKEVSKSLVESAFYKALITEVDASSIKNSVKIKPKTNGFDVNIEIDIKAKDKNEVPGVPSLKKHGIKLKIKQGYIVENASSVNLFGNTDLAVAVTEDSSTEIEIYNNNKLFNNKTDLEDEEYIKSIQDLIEHLETNELDRANGKATFIEGFELPTSIPGLNVYFDVYLNTEFAFNFKLNSKVETSTKRVFGLSVSSRGVVPFKNVETLKNSCSLTAKGEAEMKFGIGLHVGLSVVDKDLLHAALGAEFGLYEDAYILGNMEVDTSKRASMSAYIDGRMELGLYLNVNYSVGSDLLKITAEDTLAEVKVPLLRVGKSDITTEIKLMQDYVFVENGIISKPRIGRNVMNIDTKKSVILDISDKVEFKKLNGEKLEVSDGKINVGTEKYIDVIYKEGLGIYIIRIEVTKYDSTSNVNSSTFNSSSKFNSVKDIYKDFIKKKKYRQYTSKASTWNLGNKEIEVEDYAILDINKDGIEELFLQGVSGTSIGLPFYQTLIITYNPEKRQLIMLDDIYSYGSIFYDNVDLTIGYSIVRYTSLIGYFETHKLINNKFYNYKTYGYDAAEFNDDYYNESGKNRYFIYTDTYNEILNSKEEVFERLNKNRVNINYQKISTL